MGKPQPKKSNTPTQNKDKKGDVPVFKNPTETIWGKIIVWILVLGFVGSIVGGIILLII